MLENNLNINIRKAQTKDYPAICSLINNEIGYKSIKLHDLSSRIKKMNQDENYFTFVVLHDDQVIGFIGLMKFITYDFNGSCMRILSIAVAKEYQNKGIGKYLLDYADQFATTKNVAVLMVGSELKLSDAHRFYEKNGFNKSSYGFWKVVSSYDYIEK